MATTVDPTPTATERDPHRWWTLAVTGVAMLLIGLDTTVLNVALPTLSEDLGASTSQLQWFADAFLLVLASLLLPAGMLGDRWGRRPLMLAALGVFAAGSAWCAYAGSPGSLIAARAFLGLGAALLIPLAFSLLVVLFDREERPRAMAILGLSTMIGMPLGPIVGGELLRHFWWGSVFVLNVPVALLAFAASWWLLPRERPAPRPPIDRTGIVLSSVGLVSLTFGLIEGPTRGWSSPAVWGTLATGLTLLVGFLRWERGVTGAEPLLDRSLWRIPEFRWGALAASLASVIGFVALFTAPLYLQAILGTDPLGTGVRLLPLIGGLMVGFAVAVRLASLVGPRLPMAVGFAAVVAATVVGTRTTVSSGYGLAALWLTLVGLGFGMVLISGQNLAIDTLAAERAGAGGAAIQVMRQVSSVLGIAALVSILNTTYRAQVDVTGLPVGAVDAVKDSVSGGLVVAARLGSPDLAASVREAFVAGIGAQMWVTCGLAVVGLAVTLWKLPNTRPGQAALEES